jgi:hypothetical protein
MTRPLVLVYQELAQQTPQTVEPELPVLVAGPAYQILDYVDDKADIQVADYGTLNAANPYTPPVANTAAIVLAAPPGIRAGAWVDPTSVGVYFDDFRVIMGSGSDGSTTSNDNLFTSASAAFTTTAAVGDTLIVGSTVYTISSIVSATSVRVTTNFTSTVGSLAYRVERQLNDTQIASAFVSLPTYRSSNELTILGGITVAVNGIQRTVAYAKVYVAYRAYRTDLQFKDSIAQHDEIETMLGKIDARNPLASHVSVAKQNAGQAPVFFFGVETDDLVGYTNFKDAISSDKEVYAIVVCNPDIAILAMLRTDNVTLADPTQALATGVPQKFRAGLGSEELVTTQAIVPETVTGTTEQLAGAVPPGVKTITFSGATNFLSSNVRPGDQLILTASENAAPIDGTYAISHINGALALEVDTAFPIAIAVAEGVNYRVFRPSTGADVVALVDGRARLVNQGVTYYSRVAGVTPGARTIALVEDATTANGIHSIVEVAGVSTVINGNFASGNITQQEVVDALTAGSGVTVPFAGSVNLTATCAAPATAVSAALAAAALSTGVAGADNLASTAVLDAIYNRLFDSTATFLTAGVLPGDIIEIPLAPNGVFATGVATRRFEVDQVLSEQRLQIANIVSGSYVNNTSTVENELPHLDNRQGTGTTVTQGAIRYKLTRELTKDQQVTSLVSIAQSLDSQRAVMAWPDLVGVAGLVDGSKPRNVDGSAALADPQPGTYLAAAVGGMTAGLPNHQGFTNLGIAGIDRLYHSNGYFTERQLTQISDGGWMVFVQDTPESLPYCIHQLTTDPSSLQTGEYSMVKNFDYLSRFFVATVRDFIGKWNVNEETLGFLRQALNSGIQQLKSKRVARIGAPIIDASIRSLAVSTASPDRVEVYMDLSRPVPLNTLGLHLIG